MSMLKTDIYISQVLNSNMKQITDNIGLLEKPVGTMKILVHIHRNEKTTITGLLKNEQLNQRTTYSALEKLQERGLIFQEESLGFPLCKYYFLTDKGKEVAKKLELVAGALAR